MAQSETWSIGRLLQWTADYLKKHGSDNPRLESEVLLAHALGCERIQLYTRFNEEPEEAARGRFRELVRHRAEGTPVAYLVGHREFYSMSFEVTPAVLIPRPETEFLVIEILDLLKQPGFDAPEVHVADVGTGSGIIAVAVAHHEPRCRLTAVDISSAALQVAAANAERHGVSERVTLLESDLLAAVPDSVRFDIIASNPPYVTREEYEALPAEIKEREPKIALEAGERGMDVIDRLLPEAAARLRTGGALVLEISPMLEGRVRAALAADTRWGPCAIIRDLAGHSRVARVFKQG